jgi:hypothetical protein
VDCGQWSASQASSHRPNQFLSISAQKSILWEQSSYKQAADHIEKKVVIRTSLTTAQFTSLQCHLYPVTVFSSVFIAVMHIDLGSDLSFWQNHPILYGDNKRLM